MPLRTLEVVALNGNLKIKNITRDEAVGMKSIKKKVKVEWVVTHSDKSKRPTANTKRNYLERLNAHTEGDTVGKIRTRSREN